MREEIIKVVKVEYLDIVQGVSDLFENRMKTVSPAIRGIGEYLIGISDKPWRSMAFTIGDREFADSFYQQRNYDQIIVVGEII